MPCGPSTDQHHRATAGSGAVRARTPPGAPVLRAQGPDRPAGHGKADASRRPIDHLLAKEVRAGLQPPTTASRPAQRAFLVSLNDRWCPLWAAATGTWMARPARTNVARTCWRRLPARVEGEAGPGRPPASLARTRGGSRHVAYRNPYCPCDVLTERPGQDRVEGRHAQARDAVTRLCGHLRHGVLTARSSRVDRHRIPRRREPHRGSPRVTVQGLIAAPRLV